MGHGQHPHGNHTLEKQRATHGLSIKTSIPGLTSGSSKKPEEQAMMLIIMPAALAAAVIWNFLRFFDWAGEEGHPFYLRTKTHPPKT